MQDIEKIYRKHFRTVYKFLFCLTHNDNISEDLAQETFYKVAKNINSFKGNSKLTVWLCQIAKNLWIDELRKNKITITNEINEELASEIDLEEEYITKDSILKIYKNIDKMDENIKKVMYLRLKEDLSFKQIGDILGESENWARVNFYRGKQKLKEVINNEKEL